MNHGAPVEGLAFTAGNVEQAGVFDTCIDPICKDRTKRSDNTVITRLLRDKETGFFIRSTLLQSCFDAFFVLHADREDDVKGG